MLLVAAIGGLTYFIASNGKQRKPVPDGSIVVLNKHGSLTYPTRFDEKERKVKLTGEGFFTVTHNMHQPFVVECNDVNVQVVGTSFNVKSSVGGTEIIV